MSNAWARSGWLHLTKTRNSQPEKGTTRRKAKSRDRETMVLNERIWGSEVIYPRTPCQAFFFFFHVFVLFLSHKQIKFTLSLLVCVRLLLLMTESDPMNKKEDEAENLGMSWQSKMEGWTREYQFFREKNENWVAVYLLSCLLWHLNQKPASLPNR